MQIPHSISFTRFSSNSPTLDVDGLETIRYIPESSLHSKPAGEHAMAADDLTWGKGPQPFNLAAATENIAEILSYSLDPNPLCFFNLEGGDKVFYGDWDGTKPDEHGDLPGGLQRMALHYGQILRAAREMGTTPLAFYETPLHNKNADPRKIAMTWQATGMPPLILSGVSGNLRTMSQFLSIVSVIASKFEEVLHALPYNAIYKPRLGLTLHPRRTDETWMPMGLWDGVLKGAKAAVAFYDGAVSCFADGGINRTGEEKARSYAEKAAEILST
jgi:hypothetical protein